MNKEQKAEALRTIRVVTAANVDGLPHFAVDTVFASAHGTRADDAFTSALELLKERAYELGANAVVAVSHEAMSIRKEHSFPSYFVSLIGTAVKLPWPEGNADPILFENGTPE